jgi:hypothetical protein
MRCSALTIAELAAGPHAALDSAARAVRQDRLAWAESLFDAIPFDHRAARAYGRIFAATMASGRKPRGARALDLLIAAVALANNLPLVTRNPDDVAHLASVGLTIIAV